MKIIIKKFLCNWPYQIVINLIESNSEYIITTPLDEYGNYWNEDEHIAKYLETEKAKYIIFFPNYSDSDDDNDNEEYQDIITEQYHYKLEDRTDQNYKLRTDAIIIKLIEESTDNYTKENFKIIEIPNDLKWHLELDNNDFEIVCENYRQWNKENEMILKSTCF